MDFFDKLGKKASQTYKGAAQITGKFTKEAKLKMLINDDKDKIEELYLQIGKKVYQKHIKKESMNIEEELLDECSKIDVLSDEIEISQNDILNLRDKKQCSKCHIEIEQDCKFCPNCGTEQEVNKAEEVKSNKEDQSIEILAQTEDMLKDKTNIESETDIEEKIVEIEIDSDAENKNKNNNI